MNMHALPEPNMYRYDEFDRKFVDARVAQFRDQVARRLDGTITEDEFKPMRLMNGLYHQLHAYMLRVAVPYGTMSSRQLNSASQKKRPGRCSRPPTKHCKVPFSPTPMSAASPMLDRASKSR